jgi:hypothetical protein
MLPHIFAELLLIAHDSLVDNSSGPRFYNAEGVVKETKQFANILQRYISTLPPNISKGISLSALHKPKDVVAAIELIDDKEAIQMLMKPRKLWQQLGDPLQIQSAIWISLLPDGQDGLSILCAAFCLIIRVRNII